MKKMVRFIAHHFVLTPVIFVVLAAAACGSRHTPTPVRTQEKGDAAIDSQPEKVLVATVPGKYSETDLIGDAGKLLVENGCLLFSGQQAKGVFIVAEGELGAITNPQEELIVLERAIRINAPWEFTGGWEELSQAVIAERSVNVDDQCRSEMGFFYSGVDSPVPRSLPGEVPPPEFVFDP
jgi:hypothetical protein